MSVEKDTHMETFITERLQPTVIRPSNARHHSQIHLVVKSEADATTVKTDAAYPTGYDRSSNSAQAMLKSDNDSQSPKPLGFAKSKLTTPAQASSAIPTATPPRKRRTTIDHRQHYNNCIVKPQNWPLPSISAMKARIGKANAQTKEKLFENLILIFERFRKHKITSNPDKVHLSDSKLEFVGHEFTHDGTQFSKNKTNGVNNTPIPTTKGDLKKFLGIANYFREHVRKHPMLAQPLQLLLSGYTRAQRNHKLAWQDESKDLFLTLRDNVAN